MRAIYVFFLLLCFRLSSEENFLLINAITDESILKFGPNVDHRTTPCSSFKIALCLMGYDAKVLENKELPIWDFQEGYLDYIDSWKVSQTPQSWIKNSCVWFSQLLIALLGPEKVENYLQLFAYGNQDMSGGLQHAWLGSSLKISPQEQVDFLQRIVRNEIPVANDAVLMTKVLLFKEELPGGWKMYGKTGFGDEADLEIGWFVGWIEKEEEVYVFAYNIRDRKVDPALRVSRVKELLAEHLIRFIK